jgi:hypothetical protein
MTFIGFQLPFDALVAVLLIPAAAAIVLVLLPGYWLSARLNVLAAFLTFLAALSTVSFGALAMLASVPINWFFGWSLILSAFVLNGVSLTMGYAWEHPIFIDIRRPTIVPPAAWKARPKMQPGPTAPAEPSLYTEQGRVLLIFSSPSHPAVSAQPAKPSPQGTVPTAETGPATGNTGVATLTGVLQSYAGTYVGQAPGSQRVRVTTDSGRLQLEVVGEFRSPLEPLPNSQLLACVVGDCWVTFSTSAKGTVDRIEVHHLGREVVAFREQRGMVF